VWALEGAVNGAGAAVEAVAAELGIDRPAERLAGWLDAWPDDGDAEPPLFLNGVAGLGSPWWRPRFRSRFAGAGADCAEPRLRLVAVAESVVFLVAVNLERLAAVPDGPPLARIVATGGLARWDGLCRRLAEATGLPVDRPAAGAGSHEATARGIAWLAAGGPEGWEPPPTERFEPRPDPALAARFARWREAMTEALAAEAADEKNEGAG
jgi:glycerol kinase